MTARDDSMRSLIERGDVLMIDTAVARFAGDDVYLITLSGVTQAKVLQARFDGLYVVSANRACPEHRIPQEDVGNLRIGGKVLVALSAKVL